MASTGLLSGVNPYVGGNVVVDITSKPLQYMLMEKAKQDAKAEAIDKYYKDYEKSLNSAGLTPEELKIFNQKLNEVKGFAIKNKDQIGYPSKYGYDAQSTLESGFRALSNYLGEAKKAAGERKAFKTFHDQQLAQGKHVSDNYLDVWNEAMLPVGSGYVAPDISKVKFYNQFDPTKFGQKLDVLLKKNEGMPTKEFMKDPVTGKVSTTEYQWITPKYVNKDEARSIAYNELKGSDSDGYKEYLLSVKQDPVFINHLGKIYQENTGKKLDINDLGELSYANVLSQVPVIKDRSNEVYLTEDERTNLAIKRQARSADAKGAYAVPNFLEGGVAALRTGNASVINDYFKPFKAQTKTGTSGEVIGFENIDVLPDGKVKINYSLPMTINRKGVSIVTKNPQSRIIDPRSGSVLQEITALYQELLGSNVKAEGAAVQNLPAIPTTPSKIAKTKGSANIKWK